MPRPKTQTRESIASAALVVFWEQGYCATSIDDLIRHTGASRQSLYACFGGKRELFLATLDQYQIDVVTPAFERVERDGADLSDVAAYFRYQIKRAETMGLPGPGCLIANTMTEVAARDREIRERVHSHNQRLQAGFANALRTKHQVQTVRSVEEGGLNATAAATVVFAQGLWSASRAVDNAAPLYEALHRYLELLRLDGVCE